MKGHDAPLLKVISLDNEVPLVISCDTKGFFKIWDIQNFQLLNSYNHSNETSVVGMAHFPRQRRVASAYFKIYLFDFDSMYQPELTDDQKISCLAYSEINLELYIASEKSIKVWIIQKGIIGRQFLNISDSNIKSLCLQIEDRKLFFGNVQGEIIMIDVFTGTKLKNLGSHQKDTNFLFYFPMKKLLCSVGNDKTVKIHTDNPSINTHQDRKTVLRNIYNAQSKDIISADIQVSVMVIATVGLENEIRIWDCANCKLVYQFSPFNDDVVFLKFLEPYPLLISIDIAGNLIIWSLPPHHNGFNCLYSYEKLIELDSTNQVTSATYEIVENDNQKYLIIIIGDEKGQIHMISIKNLCDIFEYDYYKLAEDKEKQFYYRIDDIFAPSTRDISNWKNYQNPVYDSKLTQINIFKQFKAHKEAVTYIKILKITDQVNYLSCGHEQIVRLWNEKGEQIGHLKQKFITENKEWKFVLKQDITLYEKNQMFFLKIKDNLGEIYKQRKHKEQQREDQKQKKILDIEVSSSDSELETDKDDQKNMSASVINLDSTEIYRDLVEVDRYLDRRVEFNTNQKNNIDKHKRKTKL